MPFKFFGLCRNRAHRGRAGAVVVGVGGWWWWFGVGHARGPDPSTLEKFARRRRHGGGDLLGFSSSGPRAPEIFKGNCNIQHLELGNLRHFFFFAVRVFFGPPRESIFLSFWGEKAKFTSPSWQNGPPGKSCPPADFNVISEFLASGRQMYQHFLSKRFILGNSEGISQNNYKGATTRCRPRGPPSAPSSCSASQPLPA